MAVTAAPGWRSRRQDRGRVPHRTPRSAGVPGRVRRVGGVFPGRRADAPGRPAFWSRLPSFAEFDGQVIRQWIIKGDDDSPSFNCVAVDDGTSMRAWAFYVSAAQYSALVPGTFVHVRVNPRRNRPLRIEPTEPPPVAPRLAAVRADRQPGGLAPRRWGTAPTPPPRSGERGLPPE